MSAISEAPTHFVPTARLASVELPYTLPPQADPSRLQSTVTALGGLAKLSQQLGAQDPNDPVELQLNPHDVFAHPVQGEVAETSNILVKVSKRRRKDGTGEKFFKIEPVGVIDRTVRFRAMADFQYAPDTEDRISKLAESMRNMDVEALKAFRFEQENEDHEQNLRLFPPPMFSRLAVPHIYQYKHNTASVSTTFTRSDGIEVERLVNRMRYHGSAVVGIRHADGKVPEASPPHFWSQKEPDDDIAFQNIQQAFAERPIWTRSALLERDAEIRRIESKNNFFLAYSCYRFLDGPFRDLLIRFNYDPRVDPQSRFYQRILLRNTENKRQKPFAAQRGLALTKPSKDRAVQMRGETLSLGDAVALRTEHSTQAKTSLLGPAPTYIFDGKRLPRPIGNYQLVDITDPTLYKLIHSDLGLVSECGHRDGWYTANAMDQIRAILRRKFFGLLENPPRVVSEAECLDLLEIDVRPGSKDVVPKQGHIKAKPRAKQPQRRRDAVAHRYADEPEREDDDDDEENGSGREGTDNSRASTEGSSHSEGARPAKANHGHRPKRVVAAGPLRARKKRPATMEKSAARSLKDQAERVRMDVEAEQSVSESYADI